MLLLGNGLLSFSFLLKIRCGRDHMYCTKTNIYVISYEKVKTLCNQFYLLLKPVIWWKNIIKKNHFAEAAGYLFANVNYHFAGENWEKPILCQQFFASTSYNFCWHKLTKALFYMVFSCQDEKSELQRLNEILQPVVRRLLKYNKYG